MHSTKDFSQKLAVLRAFFQLGQTPLHAVQSFRALNQEFSRQLVHRYVIGQERKNLSVLAVLRHSR
jgi:hypothetical protein